MKTNTSLNLPVNNLFTSENGAFKEYKICQKIKNFDKEIVISQPITGKICLMKISQKEISAEYDLKTSMMLNCARCLKNYLQTIRLKFNNIYGLDGENFQEFIRGNTLNVLPTIQQEIILKVPLKPLCQEKCQGLKGYNIRKE